MDKSSYESYEYINAAENDANQFFVVQDDGTFLNVNRQIQYVTQVQDAKEGLEGVEPCTVYDVSSQQFFIDVDNSAELISVSDQFILPDGENNIFANNYLLPVANSAEQVEEQSIVNQYQGSEAQVAVDVESQDQKQIDGCTEITLSDEQYRILEQKGWILLETNDKVYILDTLGLHDITSNDKLIQKLKQANQTYAANGAPGNHASLSNQQDAVQYVIGEDGLKVSKEIVQRHDALLNDVQPVETLQTKIQNEHVQIPPTVYADSTYAAPTDWPQDNDTVKVKTDIIFKDIPDKLLLGHTENGKRMFAKIKRLDNNNVKKEVEGVSKNNLKPVQQRKPKTSSNNKNYQESQLHSSGISEAQFETLIRSAMQNSEGVKCTADDVASADGVVTQLLKVPTFKPSVLDRNLVITKEILIQQEVGALRNSGTLTLVTGRVTSLDDNRYYFVHLPGMLRTLMATEDNLPSLNRGGASQTPNVAVGDNNILHVHVTEIKRADNVLRVSITLNKRKLPDMNTPADSLMKNQSSLVFGCSSCAAVFQTETELREHQQIQCMDVDDILTIDIDKNNKGYTIENKGRDKFYTCNLCQVKFQNEYNCIKHLKTHYDSKKSDNVKDQRKPEGKEESKDGIYKCPMCTSTYMHTSTLSKHIVAKHIKIRPQ